MFVSNLEWILFQKTICWNTHTVVSRA